MVAEVQRDRWDRPLIIPPDGGAAVPYYRVTKFVDVLEDTFNIKEWEKRTVAIGLAERDDLLLAVASLSKPESDKDEERKRKAALNRICEQAKEAGGGSKSATTGTALHKVTERLDLGEEMPSLPGPYQADIDAFANATQMLTPVEVEKFLVNDYVKAAGTADRLYRIGERPALTIGDTKTGSNIQYGMIKISMQLATYSRSVGYDPATGERETLELDQDWGLVVHLPAGTGECELVWVNLQIGWGMVLLAQDVRDARKMKFKDLTRPVDFEDLIA